MTDVSEAAKLNLPPDAAIERALELAFTGTTLADVKRHWPGHTAHIEFARYIQQVSDAIKAASNHEEVPGFVPPSLAPFILPDPVDPLVDALKCAVDFRCDEVMAGNFREQLAKRGLKIVEAQP